MIESLIDQSIERLADYCSKKENLEVLNDRIVSPMLQHIAMRFSWITMSVQFMIGLLFIQTVLLIILMFKK